MLIENSEQVNVGGHCSFFFKHLSSVDLAPIFVPRKYEEKWRGGITGVHTLLLSCAKKKKAALEHA